MSINKNSYPKISIVTPSYNYGHFIEETINSVLNQGYPNLEYIIIDGGSTDGTVDIIRKYEKYLTFWVSEPDDGQYHAINKGFERSTGEIMAWLNADDKYVPWALWVVGDVMRACPQVEWLTSQFPMRWNQQGWAIGCTVEKGFNFQAFLHGYYTSGYHRFKTEWIQQESTFWRRSLWKKVGGCLDQRLKLAADFDLWAKFFRYAELYAVSIPLGGFRMHPNRRSSIHIKQYHEEAYHVFANIGGRYLTPFELWIKNNLIRRLPIRLAKLLFPHLIYDAKFIINDHEGKWQIQTGYFI